MFTVGLGRKNLERDYQLSGRNFYKEMKNSVIFECRIRIEIKAEKPSC